MTRTLSAIITAPRAATTPKPARTPDQVVEDQGAQRLHDVGDRVERRGHSTSRVSSPRGTKSGVRNRSTAMAVASPSALAGAASRRSATARSSTLRPPVVWIALLQQEKRFDVLIGRTPATAA